MRIAFVVEHCNLRGGHERCVAEWAKRLAARGHSVSIYSHSIADLEPGTVEWHFVPPLKGPAPLSYLGFYFRAGAMTKLLTDTIIHSQGPNAPRFNVSSIHTVIREKLNVLLRLKSMRKEMSTMQYLSWYVHYRLAIMLEHRLYRHPDGMLAPVSIGTARELSAHYRSPDERLSVVPNGVDMDVFCPGSPDQRARTLSRWNLNPEMNYLLFVGGEWARKGLPTAMEALSLSSTSESVHLIVAGNGPVERYRKQAVQLGIHDRIHFLGLVPDTPSLYRSGLALLMPSHYEAFSLVSLEAAASGLPIIASPVSGTEELVHDGDNGWVLPRDARQWSRCIETLATDTQKTKAMGLKSRELASQFTWDNAVIRFEELYGT